MTRVMGCVNVKYIADAAHATHTSSSTRWMDALAVFQCAHRCGARPETSNECKKGFNRNQTGGPCFLSVPHQRDLTLQWWMRTHPRAYMQKFEWSPRSGALALSADRSIRGGTYASREIHDQGPTASPNHFAL